MRTITRTTLAAFGLVAAGTLGLTACGSGEAHGGNQNMDQNTGAAAYTSPGDPNLKTATDIPAATSDSDLVGSGCAAYEASVPTGDGSIAGMAQDPVAVAAGDNPLLTTLSSAISGGLNAKVNLVDTLDSAEYTVFAPVDDAFAKLPAAKLAALAKPGKADTLTKLLTSHVVAGQLSPGQIDGTHETLAGGSVTVTGSGDDITVDGAKVICGGITTSNATVYLLDTVLTPAS
jgi:uncharacterized surface protein with fasciclin (FAS1) repeats